MAMLNNQMVPNHSPIQVRRFLHRKQHPWQQKRGQEAALDLNTSEVANTRTVEIDMSVAENVVICYCKPNHKYPTLVGLQFVPPIYGEIRDVPQYSHYYTQSGSFHREKICTEL